MRETIRLAIADGVTLDRPDPLSAFAGPRAPRFGDETAGRAVGDAPTRFE